MISRFVDPVSKRIWVLDRQNGFVPVGKWRRHWPIRRPEDGSTTSGEVRCSTTDPDLLKTQTRHSLADSKLTFWDRTNQNLTNSKKKNWQDSRTNSQSNYSQIQNFGQDSIDYYFYKILVRAPMSI